METKHYTLVSRLTDAVYRHLTGLPQHEVNFCQLAYRELRAKTDDDDLLTFELDFNHSFLKGLMPVCFIDAAHSTPIKDGSDVFTFMLDGKMRFVRTTSELVPILADLWTVRELKGQKSFKMSFKNNGEEYHYHLLSEYLENTDKIITPYDEHLYSMLMRFSTNVDVMGGYYIRCHSHVNDTTPLYAIYDGEGEKLFVLRSLAGLVAYFKDPNREENELTHKRSLAGKEAKKSILKYTISKRHIKVLNGTPMLLSNDWWITLPDASMLTCHGLSKYKVRIRHSSINVPSSRIDIFHVVCGDVLLHERRYESKGGVVDYLADGVRELLIEGLIDPHTGMEFLKEHNVETVFIGIDEFSKLKYAVSDLDLLYHDYRKSRLNGPDDTIPVQRDNCLKLEVMKDSVTLYVGQQLIDYTTRFSNPEYVIHACIDLLCANIERVKLHLGSPIRMPYLTYENRAAIQLESTYKRDGVEFEILHPTQNLTIVKPMDNDLYVSVTPNTFNDALKFYIKEMKL